MKKRAAASKPVKPSRRKQVFPRGWNEKRVQEVIAYYDNQTEDEGAAEYEAAMNVDGLTVMLVPTDLVPEIRQLIGRRRGA
jgi:hypothetical protein